MSETPMPMNDCQLCGALTAETLDRKMRYIWLCKACQKVAANPALAQLRVCESELASLRAELATIFGPSSPREGVTMNDAILGTIGTHLCQQDVEVERLRVCVDEAEADRDKWKEQAGEQAGQCVNLHRQVADLIFERDTINAEVERLRVSWAVLKARLGPAA